MNDQSEAPNSSPFVLQGREPPNNMQAEQGLLGAILLDNRALDRVSAFLDPAHFYDPVHAQIYNVARRAIQSGRLATPVSLKSYFENSPDIYPANGGPPIPVINYLGTLAVAGVAVPYAHDYGRTVYDLFVRREMADIAADMMAAAYDASIDSTPAEQIDEAETRLDALRVRGRNERATMTIYQAMMQSIEQTNAAHMAGSDLVGLSTGIRALDAKLGGMAPSDLIVVGARPGMGKSAFAGTIGLNVAKSSGKGTGFFSLEMSADQIGTRALAGDTGIDTERQRRGQVDDEDMRRLMAAAETYRDAPFHIDQSGGLTLAQLANNARRLCRTENIGLLIVDYLQIMGSSTARRMSNRVQEITEITTGLKALAKELNRPVMLLSQLNRKSEDGEDNRPQLSHLRESGSIEQDADIVMLLYREEYYLSQSKPGPDAQPAVVSTWSKDMERARGLAEVIIAKHRHGPTGVVELNFDGARALFMDRGSQ